MGIKAWPILQKKKTHTFFYSFLAKHTSMDVNLKLRLIENRLLKK
jgi:hypothetical protein